MSKKYCEICDNKKQGAKGNHCSAKRVGMPKDLFDINSLGDCSDFMTKRTVDNTHLVEVLHALEKNGEDMEYIEEINIYMNLCHDFGVGSIKDIQKQYGITSNYVPTTITTLVLREVDDNGLKTTQLSTIINKTSFNFFYVRKIGNAVEYSEILASKDINNPVIFVAKDLWVILAPFDSNETLLNDVSIPYWQVVDFLKKVSIKNEQRLKELIFNRFWKKEEMLDDLK